MKTHAFRWLAVALVCLAGTAELVSRSVLGLGTPPLSVTHPTIEYLFRPDQDLYRFGNHIVINGFGMRSRPFAKTRGPGELRVMIFGDSILNGGNRIDQAELATTIVEEELAHGTGHDVIVGNISAKSWGPGNWLAYAEAYGFFDADIVAVVVSSHDWRDNPSFAPLNPDTHPTAPPVSAFVEGLTRYLPRYIPALRRAQEPAAEVDSGTGRGDDPAVRRSLADFSRLLQLARAAADSVLVVQHWERSEVEGGIAKPGYAEFHAICEAMQVPCVSLMPYYRRALDEGINPYQDNIHLNAAGQQILAQALIEALGRLGPVGRVKEVGHRAKTN